jgi:hypothetical protein
MRPRKRTKLVHEGEYVAEIDVDVIETDKGRSPFFQQSNRKTKVAVVEGQNPGIQTK